MDKEIIEQIKSQLKEHEESYTPGAWERFAEKDRKRKGFAYWPFWTAAAVVLVFLGLFFAVDQTPKNTQVATSSKTRAETKNLNKNSINTHLDSLERNKNQISAAEKINKLSNSNINNFSITPLTNLAHAKNLADGIKQAKPITFSENLKAPEPTQGTSESNKENQNIQASPTVSFEQLLVHDSKAGSTQKLEKGINHSKWESGIFVAPAVGNDNRVNLNYGFSFSYSVADKLSISSGVSYASLSSSETLTNASPQALSAKTLGSVNAKVSGINIPLELRYKISENLYTGIGISALAVLNNSQSNTYLSNEVQTFASPSAVQPMDLKKYIVQEKIVEPQTPASVQPDNYIGFYNFSLGYKQKISKKNNISVEPFLQLPMKTFSKENLNLTNGGIRLKLDF